MIIVLSLLCATWFVIGCVQSARAWWYHLLYQGSLTYMAGMKMPQQPHVPQYNATPYVWDASHQDKAN